MFKLPTIDTVNATIHMTETLIQTLQALQQDPPLNIIKAKQQSSLADLTEIFNSKAANIIRVCKPTYIHTKLTPKRRQGVTIYETSVKVPTPSERVEAYEDKI